MNTRAGRFLEYLGSNYRIYTAEQLSDLISAENHPSYINEHRAVLIIDRVRFFAALLALLLPLWLLVDHYVFGAELFPQLAAIRMLSVAAFAYQARYRGYSRTLSSAYLILIAFLINLPLTFGVTVFLLSGAELHGGAEILFKIYALLPFLAVTSLGVFPLTLYETLAFVIPLGSAAIGSWSLFGAQTLVELLPSTWLLLMLMALVLFTATIQMQYIISLVSRTSFDPLTGALTRRSGTDALTREFQMSIMHNDNFAIALISLDDGEKIAAEHNYPVYYYVILEAVKMLQQELRDSDLLIKWCEREFLVVLPNTDIHGVEKTLSRIHARGISSLPDGTPVTASMGTAERIEDKVYDWHELVELVTRRRDEAKSSGRDRTVSTD